MGKNDNVKFNATPIYFKIYSVFFTKYFFYLSEVAFSFQKKKKFCAISLLIFIKFKKKKQILTLCKTHLVKLNLTTSNSKFYTVVHLQGIFLQQTISFVDKTVFTFQNTLAFYQTEMSFFQAMMFLKTIKTPCK
jgi:hypothetical protein